MAASVKHATHARGSVVDRNSITEHAARGAVASRGAEPRGAPC